MMENVILEAKGICKSFSGVPVLSQVDFSVRKGEIHALMGENGAGKSTLIKILTGVYTKDSGSVFWDGKKVEINSYKDCQKLGMACIYQELSVIPPLTVAQNVFLGREPRKLGLIDHKKMNEMTQALIDQYDFPLEPGALVSNLGIGLRQLVEILKGLSCDSRLLIMDEPTASLSGKEAESLFSIIDTLRKKGVSIIYISHRMEEIFRITDRATIFRDGRYIGTVETAKTDKAELIKMMVGRNIADQRFNEVCNVREKVALEVKNLSGKGFQDISFQLHKGEVLGFAGLVGAGRTEVMRAVFGIDRHSYGQIFVNGHEVSVKKPLDAQREGIMLIPEDRKYQGMVGILSNRANIVLSNLKKYVKYGILDHAYIKKDAREYMDRLQVSPRDDEYETGRLSGGNQQKVVIARTMNANPDILILDEPTRGIDINVKFEIYKLIRQFADEGRAVIMISSELPEVISLSDRVIVMYEGRITGELNSSELTEERIMMYAMGGENNEKNEHNI